MRVHGCALYDSTRYLFRVNFHHAVRSGKDLHSVASPPADNVKNRYG